MKIFLTRSRCRRSHPLCNSFLPLCAELALVERDEGGTFVRMSEEFDRSEIEHDDDGKYRWEMAFVKAADMEIE